MESRRPAGAAQNRPSASHLPSFMRLFGRSGSGSPIFSMRPSDRSRKAKPLLKPAMKPPSPRLAIQPERSGIGQLARSPVAGT